MDKIIVSRKTWARATRNNYLFDGNKYCIVGSLCKSYGVSDALLYKEVDIYGTAAAGLLPAIIVNLGFLHAIYGVNDDPYISDAKREETLINLFETKNISIVFED